MNGLTARIVLVAATIGWTAALFVATRVAGLPERTPAGYVFSAATYAAAALVCHQRSDRSFHFWGAQFPVCARCAGIYVGAVLACLTALGRRRSTNVAGARRTLAAALALNGLTLVAEWGVPGVISNAGRAMAGAALGAAIMWLLTSALSTAFTVSAALGSPAGRRTPL